MDPEQNRSRDLDSSDEQPTQAELVNNMLEQIHPPGSFDLDITTHGNVTVAVATGNPEYQRERLLVEDNFRSIEVILELGEKRPEPGSEHTIVVGGREGKIVFDSMDNLLNLAQLGIDSARKFHTLTDDEETQIEAFNQRIEALRG